MTCNKLFVAYPNALCNRNFVINSWQLELGLEFHLIEESSSLIRDNETEVNLFSFNSQVWQVALAALGFLLWLLVYIFVSMLFCAPYVFLTKCYCIFYTVAIYNSAICRCSNHNYKNCMQIKLQIVNCSFMHNIMFCWTLLHVKLFISR